MTDSMPGPASHTFFSQRLRLHYVDWGNADKPPLLLIHGGRDHCRNWDWTAAALRNDWHIIAPDLRGHGDSQWSTDGSYSMAGYIYDLAQLIHGSGWPGHHRAIRSAATSRCATPVSTRDGGQAGVHRGRGPSPQKRAERSEDHRRTHDEWIREQRTLACRLPRRYASIEDAFRRMQEENPHLSAEQARHLTVHGVNQNEDGTYSWKFDNYVRVFPPYDMRARDIALLYSRITCSTLLLYGKESWSGNPARTGASSVPPRLRDRLRPRRHWLHTTGSRSSEVLRQFLTTNHPHPALP